MLSSIAARATLSAMALLSSGAGALDDGLALTPPRGFRTWNLFGLRVTQPLMEQIMDAMKIKRVIWNGANMSLADLGYDDVGLDDGWQACHDGVNKGYHQADGSPIVNKSIFPDFKALTDYAHARNLTAGWYGNNCYCADSSSAVVNFEGDVAALIEYGFDGVKLDSCGGQKDIALWQNLIEQTKKKVVIENCHNGPWLPEPPRKPNSPVWCPFHMYRSSTDIEATYGVIMGQNLQTLIPLAAANLSFPGCWAYADMLEVGVSPGLHKGETGLTFTEARSHFGAWAVTSNPLILGLDVRNETLMASMWDIVSNTEALYVNSNWAGSSGNRIMASPENVTWAPCGWYENCTAGAWEVWSKPLSRGAAAVLILNHQENATATVTLTLADIPGLYCGSQPVCAVHDVWNHAQVGTFATTYTTSVGPHDSVFLSITHGG